MNSSIKHNILLEHSYLTLPESFYTLVKPTTINNSELVLLNDSLIKSLNLYKEPFSEQDFFNELIHLAKDNKNRSFAQAYAGHQFGNFTVLGDGRAIVLGELVTNNIRYDIQIKGSGKTLYSRRGDGKATLRSVLREYLMSEALYYLKINTSRSLLIAKTNEPVYREDVNEGALLIRVMKSHLRIGTFELAGHLLSKNDLWQLTYYTVNRLFPELLNEHNIPLALLKHVIELQLDLVAQWMRIGFIHGVMNTDNVAISGETFDYGPCAFINTYHPFTVFSSIDTYGRYAFGQQPTIIMWNLTRFAEALLPIIDDDLNKAISMAQEVLNTMHERWTEKFYTTMLLKLGISPSNKLNFQLVDELLQIMQKHGLDYTNTFLAITYPSFFYLQEILKNEDFYNWYTRWQNVINKLEPEKTFGLMKENNPFVIPRNHLVEEALNNATLGNFNLFNKFIEVLKEPYSFKEENSSFTAPPPVDFDKNYQTFCGT